MKQLDLDRVITLYEKELVQQMRSNEESFEKLESNMLTEYQRQKSLYEGVKWDYADILVDIHGNTREEEKFILYLEQQRQ